MRWFPMMLALSLLLGGVALSPAPVGAADWISNADSYASAWVKEIESELNKKEHRAVFLNDPRAPQASVLRLLDRAAMAYNAKNEALARQLVNEALEVIASGVRKNYYTLEEVQPIISFIKQHAPVKIG